ncbi:5-formyltetrahydrofolate cyclo-ligase [Pedobacter boryungensis]|uniref:5-formyltetrahydrofolate cyclo-ligase n=1 Tax=Pedobacter boryungensis TaxID=869962 RepID=A0ABX2DBR4_9SPHI|nr:5-formyltetrahydrofolate cyclo-ligase [Pedobacter boryungensis]NQX31467.1 5-formyltetrahydrofolate cyclo-ligase [Pedobacter boryungensis]
MTKSALRKQALAQRNALTESELSLLNEKLLTQFKKLNLSKVKSLHIFLPIAHQKEPDTFILIEWLQKNHPEIDIVVPKADFSSNLMSHHFYVDKSDLVNNNYQIPEPQSAAQLFTGTPDMVIIPLLAFDKRGYRVGYGKGFYDRFLQNISTQKVGLSFFDAVEEINDVHLNDIRLDKCITPTGIIEFNL